MSQGIFYLIIIFIAVSLFLAFIETLHDYPGASSILLILCLLFFVASLKHVKGNTIPPRVSGYISEYLSEKPIEEIEAKDILDILKTSHNTVELVDFNTVKIPSTNITEINFKIKSGKIFPIKTKYYYSITPSKHEGSNVVRRLS